MIHDDTQLVPQFTYERCKNCNGYGTKGFKQAPCPTCKTTGVVEIPLVKIIDLPTARKGMKQ